MNDNELFLIKQSQKGDIDAFEKLIKEYKKVAYNIALRVLHNKEDAEDISQESLVKVFKNINSFNMQSTFKVWLYRIVMNTCLDFKRKKQLVKYSIDKLIEDDENEFSKEIPDNTNNPDIIIQNKLEQQMLYDSIDKLEDDFKNIIVLRDLQDLSYKEIADVLSCNEGTVKSRLNRARKKLKDIVTDNILRNEI
ncbi:sigma-70 family RNA polymerase sigma factor [Sedimentibacter sp. zth1]|uniref:RNA polymerase sigma factor n=1 Tax=Sedimentibacter sp. zth1 TaxID=2816908 RepID=UPI001A921DA9|nr:sigma-70 family RNA polymerase sigma factor [Sedimentibacter sp. zth1]QSX07109.1 sigma-70 family RNA polymerase sigma factor [Sedimentibacter sp. zth1]